MNRRHFLAFSGPLLAVTSLLSGGCASSGGPKQASREELIATLRSLEPFQSKGRLPRANVVGAFNLEGVMHRRRGMAARGGYYGVREEWSLSSGMWLTGMLHTPLTREDVEYSRAIIDALIEGKSPLTPPGPPQAPAVTDYVPRDPKVPEFYDTIELLDRKGRVIASLELVFGDTDRVINEEARVPITGSCPPRRCKSAGTGRAPARRERRPDARKKTGALRFRCAPAE